MTGEISHVLAGRNVVLAGTYVEAAEAILPRSACHQLPTPPADFVGREVEFDALRHEIRSGGATICGLRGQGGVGKTALALVLARDLSTEYPDAQIFLDLQGVSERPVSTAEAMGHVIRAFLPEAKLPEGPQIAALYRAVLSGQRALLLMDNALGQAQVEPLIPPSGNVLLVTSRQRFALPGLVTRDLDLLPDGDAQALLREIAPRIGNRAGEIARLCGYLPLALRVAASTLVERTDLSVEEYEKRLGGEKEKAKLGGGALGLGYDLLPEAFQKSYRHLAVFVGDFDAPAAGAVWGLGEEATDETLGAFVRGSLLDGKEGRYKLHDLARAFAASQLLEEEKALGRLRHAEHFCGVLERANIFYSQGNEHMLAGLALFDRERPQIVAGQAWAAKCFQDKKEASRLASRYPNAGFRLLHLRLSPRESISWLESALAEAQQAENRRAEAIFLGNLGLSHAALGNSRLAIEYYMEQLAISREIGDRSGEGSAQGNLGSAYFSLGETQHAIDLYQQALFISREIGDRTREGADLGNLGLAHADLNGPESAIEFFEQQLAVAREMGDRTGEGNALGNLGLTHLALGQTQLAVELFEQRLAISREIGDRRGESVDSWYLGLAYEKLGDLGLAAELMQVRVDLERQIGHEDAEKHAAELEAIRVRIVGAA